MRAHRQLRTNQLEDAIWHSMMSGVNLTQAMERASADVYDILRRTLRTRLRNMVYEEILNET